MFYERFDLHLIWYAAASVWFWSFWQQISFGIFCKYNIVSKKKCIVLFPTSESHLQASGSGESRAARLQSLTNVHWKKHQVESLVTVCWESCRSLHRYLLQSRYHSHSPWSFGIVEDLHRRIHIMALKQCIHISKRSWYCCIRCGNGVTSTFFTRKAALISSTVNRDRFECRMNFVASY